MTKSEQRPSPSLEVYAPATLQLLGTSPMRNGPPVPATVVDTSSLGIRFQAGVSMETGKAVTVEIGETIFLGEVCYCAPAPDGDGSSYHLGIKMQESLTGLESLQHLITALSPRPPGDSVR